MDEMPTAAQSSSTTLIWIYRCSKASAWVAAAGSVTDTSSILSVLTGALPFSSDEIIAAFSRSLFYPLSPSRSSFFPLSLCLSALCCINLRPSAPSASLLLNPQLLDPSLHCLSLALPPSSTTHTVHTYAHALSKLYNQSQPPSEKKINQINKTPF